MKVDSKRLRGLRRYHGLTQSEVAAAAGLSQSDVSEAESGKRGADTVTRVFEGIVRSTGPVRAVRLHGARMREFLESVGASDVRVFGSASRGDARWDSDIDIVATMPEGTSLFEVVSWEEQLRRIAGGVRVDLVPRTAQAEKSIPGLTQDAVPL